jgi:glycosyltransferase involved in cell wall biosynthesis
VNACTIVAGNYLPAARLLAESFLEHHPEDAFTILLLDATESEQANGYEILSPYEIGIDRRELHRMASIYDVKELATAVKPWLLKTLVTRGSEDVAVYFDPDIEVFAALDDVATLAREHSIVLTPHYTTPLPADGLLPDDMMILQAGTYNLGFIGVARDALGFLDWWSARLARDCLVAIDRGAFVDQRWVDFVPVLFDHVVLRDPACNVAYWNLHERRLTWTGERYEVDGAPLRFFHFSGFDASTPTLLSAHMAAWPRILLSDHPDLARICREYAAKLIERGYVEHKRLPYRFDRMARGIPFAPRIRELYRTVLEEAERTGRPAPPDPFDPATEEAFLDWLREPVGPGGLWRHLHATYRKRVDLQVAFPLVGTVHRDRFLRWLASTGRHEEQIPLELLPPLSRRPTTVAMSRLTHTRVRLEARLQDAVYRHPALARAVPSYRMLQRLALGLGARPAPTEVADDLQLDIADEPARGLNVVGYLRAELGVAELARKLIDGAERAGIRHSTITYSNVVSRQQFPFEERDGTRAPYDTNLICLNADQLPIFARQAGPRFFAGRYTIGVWFWELEVFPDAFHGAFELVDELWVASEFIRDALVAVDRKPVLIVPFPLEAPAAAPLDRAVLGLPDSFLFFFSFDFLSVPERKNAVGLVKAFERAFAPGEGPALVIKSINGDRNLAALERLRMAALGRPDVHVIDGYLEAAAEDGLMASCDCYVSLHRSEGLGLTMAEAMSYGKPVIATRYSGNLTFMDDENSYLVPYAPARVPPGCEPYPPGAAWAEPDLDRAAALMRQVYEHQDEARDRGSRAQHDIATLHSVERTAEFMSRRFAEIHELAGARGLASIS